jgi:hypothetical protein
MKLTVNDIFGLDYERLRNPIFPNQNSGIGTIPTSYSNINNIFPQGNLNSAIPQVASNNAIPQVALNSSVPPVSGLELLAAPSQETQKEEGLAALRNLLPGSLFATLLSGILPKETPQMKAAKKFYQDKFDITSSGSIGSGIMQGYNPVSGGLLYMISGGRSGTPPNVGLQRAYQQRINKISQMLEDGKYRDPEKKKQQLAELQKLKLEEQMAMESPAITKARKNAPGVYALAENRPGGSALGPGGGFSTTGGRDSGFQSASSKPSGRGRQDY